MAEREGFEPSVRFLPRRFSKPVLSATQPSLRVLDKIALFPSNVKSDSRENLKNVPSVGFVTDFAVNQRLLDLPVRVQKHHVRLIARLQFPDSGKPQRLRLGV